MRKKHLLTTVLKRVLLLSILPLGSNAQTATTQVPLNDLSSFKNPPANWSVAGSVSADIDKHNALSKTNGKGILVNITDKKKNEDIVTNFEHGDIDLSVDFMMPKGSNSGIYLQGRYEIQLLDSWGKEVMTDGDLGAVYQRWDESRPNGQFGYEGIAPRLNASRAPGLWQNMRIIFQAPKFDAAGKKIANARIVQILLNGASILENAELQGPTRGSSFATEGPMGPIRIQGDHGSVAFKNIKYTTTVNPKITDGSIPKNWWDPDKPMYLTVTDEPVLARSFVDITPDKSNRVTHAVNVGYPHNISYSYNLSNGNIFQVWKGGFIDATPMWNGRGDGNIAVIGSNVPLGNTTAVAVLPNLTTAWPDTVATNRAFRSYGYELDEKGYPTFKYTIDGLNISDRATSADGKELSRELTITGPAKDNLYVRAASGNDIIDTGNGLFNVGGQYYVKLAKGVKPVIRNMAGGKELLLPVSKQSNTSVQYSLIW